MLNFKQYIEEQALKFGNQVAPKFGNVIVLAGGGGVGKGAVVQNLLSLPIARTFNPDKFKKQIAYFDTEIAKMRKLFGNTEGAEVLNEPVNLGDPDYVSRLQAFLRSNAGNSAFEKVGNPLLARMKTSKALRDILIRDMEKLVKETNPQMSAKEVKEKSEAYRNLLSDKIDLSNQATVGLLHDLYKKVGMEAKDFEVFLSSQLEPSRLPNIVFDGTLKDSPKMLAKLKQLVKVGYKPENIHLVWVVNSNENSRANNLARDRSVPEPIREATLMNSTKTIVNVLKGKDGIAEYMNGNWYIVFSEFNANTKKTRIFNKAQGTRSIFADYVMVKRPLMAPDLSLVDKDALKRVAENLPWADFSDLGI